MIIMMVENEKAHMDRSSYLESEPSRFLFYCVIRTSLEEKNILLIIERAFELAIQHGTKLLNHGNMGIWPSQ